MKDCTLNGDKQSDQCRIGQNSNSTGSGSHFFIATNPGDTGSSQTRLVIGSAGQFGIGGFTYGTAGQVLTSGGASSPPTWTTPSGVTIANNADNKVITGGSGTNLNAEGNVYIDSNGKMSIGASSADRILDIHQSTTNAYSATGYSAADNTLLRIHNPSGTDNSGVGYHTGLEFIVASGANSVGQIGVVRTGNNIGDFFFKHRTGASSYRETLRVKSDNTTLLGGYQGTGAPNSDVELALYLIMLTQKNSKYGQVMVILYLMDTHLKLVIYQQNNATGNWPDLIMMDTLCRVQTMEEI